MRPDRPPPWPDSMFPADPYPGARPPVSFVHTGDGTSPLIADPARPSGWRIGARCLDEWLADRNAPPLSERVPVLAYGSNACPSKIARMRAARGLTGPVVVLRVRADGLAAVWSAGLRVVDDQRPATLAAIPGTVEEHAAWLAAPDQFAALDLVEGRTSDPPRYRLARVATGEVTLLDSPGVLDRPFVYAAPQTPTGDPRTDRRPLLVDGSMVRCADADQATAAALTGHPGDDRLTAATVDGVPHPDAWPDRVFTYGSLMPGQRMWPLIRDLATRTPPRPSFLACARIADTGHGYPALTLDGGADGVPGWTVELADPVAALPGLDDYEGPEYRRIRVTLDDGTCCWAWLWTAGRYGHIPLPHGWSARD